MKTPLKILFLFADIIQTLNGCFQLDITQKAMDMVYTLLCQISTSKDYSKK